jgi:hypothetical protein
MTAIEESQNEFMTWVENCESFRAPRCIKEFGDSTCEYPACQCHAMPIKATSFPEIMPIQFAGKEPATVAEFDNEYNLRTIWIGLLLACAFAWVLFGSVVYAAVSGLFK